VAFQLLAGKDGSAVLVIERPSEVLHTAPSQFFRALGHTLRRFTFKIEFRELDSSQHWKMFLAEAGLTQTIATVDPQEKEEWENGCSSCGT
jgi:hypothetical protein